MNLSYTIYLSNVTEHFLPENNLIISFLYKKQNQIYLNFLLLIVKNNLCSLLLMLIELLLLLLLLSRFSRVRLSVTP